MNNLTFNQIQHFLSKLSYPCYMETISDEWCFLDGEYHFKGEGGVYCFESCEGFLDQEDYRIVNGEADCGYTMTYVLLKSNQLTEEDFYEKYEGAM